MAERKLRFEILLYAGLFFAGFIAFLILRVPSDRLARVVIAYIENEGFEVEYDAIGDTFLPGFRLVGMRLIDTRGEAEGPVLELSELAVRSRMLPLFTGKAGLLVNAEGYGGNAEAKIANRGEVTWVEGEVSNIDLEQVPLFQQRLQLPVRGSLDSEFDLEVYPELQRSTGNVEVILGNLEIGRGKLLGAFDFPGASFGDVHGTVLMENGKLIFDRFAGQGQDISLQVEGDVDLNDPLALSRLNLNLKLKLAPRIEQALGFAFPLLGLTKTPQGEYIRRVTGTLTAPR